MEHRSSNWKISLVLCLGDLTMEVIFLLWSLMERNRKKRNLHMVLIDFKKVFDKVLRKVLQWVLKKRGVILLGTKCEKV